MSKSYTNNACMIMKEIYANEIYDDKGITVGIAVRENDVINNLIIIYGEEGFDELAVYFQNESSYLIDRYCQLIFVMEYDPQDGYTMRISDFKNNTDFLARELEVMREKNWKKSDMDRMLDLFFEIKNETNIEPAEIILKNPFMMSYN